MGKGAAFDECACYTTRRAARQLGQAVMVLMALSGGISATSAGFDETLELGGRTTAAGGR